MIYLDNASASYPKPEEVYEEVSNCIKNYDVYPEENSNEMAFRSFNKLEEARKVLASFFNIKDPSRLVFTKNATEAINIAIKGLLKPGDHVITTIGEHNSVLRPLNSLSKKGVRITLLGVDVYGQLNINNLKKEIRNNTKLIIINHASNVLGTIQYINSIGRIAKEHGIIFMVDASESAGNIAIDVDRDNIDLLTFSSHKWLFGPQGAGGIFIRDGFLINNFIEGNTSSKDNCISHPNNFPDKYESGTLNILAIASLCEGVKFIQSIGRRNMQKYIEGLMEQLLTELKKMPFVKIYGYTSIENRIPIISINIDNTDSYTMGQLLKNKNIIVRTGYHSSPLIHAMLGSSKNGTVRISPGYFNTYNHIEEIIKAITDIYYKRYNI